MSFLHDKFDARIDEFVNPGVQVCHLVGDKLDPGNGKFET
jgi:hypothetical protein